jgi:4-diphosphocytidyl-2-C-methyl-D-erythritol kinase
LNTIFQPYAPISCHAPAKVNLMLHVVGRMADGYHHLQSLVAFVPIGDQVTVKKSHALRVTADGPFAQQLPLEDSNIITAAAHWLAKMYPSIDQADIHLTKKLPVSSGIGGGSSDAAATIAALLDLDGISLSREEQQRLILASGMLGADVPLCLAHQFGHGSLMWIDGSGRESLPVYFNHHVPGIMVLVNPGKPISTQTIFQQITPPYTSFQACPPFLTIDILTYLKAQKNDLMEPAMHQEPIIGEIIKILQASPGCTLARMSGSGATCFGLFGKTQQALASLGRIKKHLPQAWGILVPKG